MADVSTGGSRRLITVVLAVLSLPLGLLGLAWIGGAFGPREQRVEGALAVDASPEPGVEPAEEDSLESPRAIDLQGHRGARGLSPENTLVGFRRALAIGVTTLEMDLALTSDGVVVVHHDETLNADTTRGPGGAWIDPGASVALHSLTREDLAMYDVGRLRPGAEYAARFPDQEPHDGARIPDLAEVIAMAEAVTGGTVRYNLELKRTPTAPERTADPDSFARAALAVVDAAGVRDRTTFQSFDFACIDALSALADDLTLACLTTEDHGGDPTPDPTPWLGGRSLADFGGSVQRLVASTGCSIWSPHIDDVDPPTLRGAREAGLVIVVWTVNTREEIGRVCDLGVDGIISDYPDRVREVLAERSAPLPTAFPLAGQQARPTR